MNKGFSNNFTHFPHARALHTWKSGQYFQFVVVSGGHLPGVLATVYGYFCKTSTRFLVEVARADCISKSEHYFCKFFVWRQGGGWEGFSPQNAAFFGLRPVGR